MNYHIITFGCQMNIYDSERIADILDSNGHVEVIDSDSADIVIINTCSVREKPQAKVVSEAGKFKDLKKSNPNLKIGIAGCVAQQEGDKLLEYDYIDFVIGTDAIPNVAELVNKVYEKKGAKASDTKFKSEYIVNQMLNRKSSLTAFVSVMKGCDKFCSYCIVPYTRGREMSRPLDDIRIEIVKLAQSGVKEVTLLGQNINNYGNKKEKQNEFVKLLETVNGVDGIERIRFVTSHPAHFSKEMIDAMADLEKVCEYLHLPLQAGSNNILKKMNRSYTYEQYKDIIEYAFKKMPNLALSSDFIVGFPTETNDEFLETIKALNEIPYQQIFAFKYSARPGTKAVNIEDNISETEKDERLQTLLETFYKNVEIVNKNAYTNTTNEVLIEGVSKMDENVLSGRNRQNKIVNFTPKAGDKVGDTVKVEITEIKRNTLFGRSI